MVRGRRAALPSPEDLAEVQPPPSRSAPRSGFEGSAWFRIDIGRNRNAEARWLLPLICRMGGVSKADIGAIRVFDRETRFEIAVAAVDRFRTAVVSSNGEGGRISPVDEARPARRSRPQAAARTASSRTERQPSTSKRQMGKLRGRPRS